tara:strand:- start:1382 stop:1924 length:543 start_codon:yes stop_codon:yes gene_type:complete
MQAEVFPDFAVKQAFREVNIERDDDIIIPHIQNNLLTICLTIILKGSTASCLLAKRKYINDKDIQYALSVCLFPVSFKLSTETGYLMNTRQLGNICNEHLKMLYQLYKKQNIETDEIKVSQETLLSLQNAVERLLRGFFEYLAKKGKGRTITYRLFDECLNNSIGQSAAEDVPFSLVTRP